MTQLFMGGSPISLDLQNIFGSTLEPVEALVLGTFLKFDKNDDGLLQLHECKHALDYLGLPGKKIKTKLHQKQIVEIDLKTFVLIIKFIVIGTDNGQFNEEISENAVAEILEDTDFVINTNSESDSDNGEKVDFNKFIDIITKPPGAKIVNPDLFSIDDSVPTPVLQNDKGDNSAPGSGGNKKSKKTIYKKRKSTKRNTRQSRKLGGQAAEVKELTMKEKLLAKAAEAAEKAQVLAKQAADAAAAKAKAVNDEYQLSAKAKAAASAAAEQTQVLADKAVVKAKELNAEYHISEKVSELGDKANRQLGNAIVGSAVYLASKSAGL